jgi:tetratricopeptide (TPR) repeat protein
LLKKAQLFATVLAVTLCTGACNMFQTPEQRVTSTLADANQAALDKNNSKAQELYQQALEAASHSKDDTQTPLVLKESGEFYLNNGQLDAAEKDLRSAVTAYQRLDNGEESSAEFQNYVRTILDLARVLSAKDKLAEAKRWYEKVMEFNSRTSGGIAGCDVSGEYKDLCSRFEKNGHTGAVTDGDSKRRHAWQEKFDQLQKRFNSEIEGDKRKASKTEALALAAEAVHLSDLDRYVGAGDTAQFDALVMAGCARYAGGDSAHAESTLKDALEQLKVIPQEKVKESQYVWMCYYYLALMRYEIGDYTKAVEYGDSARNNCLNGGTIETLDKTNCVRMSRIDKLVLDSLNHLGDQMRVARPIDAELHQLKARLGSAKQ